MGRLAGLILGLALLFPGAGLVVGAWWLAQFRLEHKASADYRTHGVVVDIGFLPALADVPRERRIHLDDRRQRMALLKTLSDGLVRKPSA